MRLCWPVRSPLSAQRGRDWDTKREDSHAPSARGDQVEVGRPGGARDWAADWCCTSTVRLTLKRLAAAGLNWPLPDDLTDAALEAKLFANAGSKQGHRKSREPDWAEVHRALKRKHVTLSIVWEEYIAGEPNGYRYSRFCELYRGWEGRLSVTMRQSHAAGEKLFIDYAGDGVPVVVDRLTGELCNAQIFVAVLGASSFTYAQASWTQGIADWIAAHVGAFAAIGGVPQLVVPDNTKAAVIKACL